MRILNRLGGIDLSSAYACIKAISKKKHETIDQRRRNSVVGARNTALNEELAKEIFELIIVFGGTASTSLIPRPTPCRLPDRLSEDAFPPEFMAALAVERDRGRQQVRHPGASTSTMPASWAWRCCRRHQHQRAGVLGPDGKIVFGLMAIKGVGRGGRGIVERRTKGGPYRDLSTCASGSTRKPCRRRLEKLVKAGALDVFRGTGLS